MNRSQSTVFVLWSQYFEEAPAALFVSELRQAGLHVKVVGLRGAHTPGIHGLVLVPDLTLGQALACANRSSCVVIPCPVKRLQMLKNDLRLSDFFQQAAANNALFVIGQADMTATSGESKGFTGLGETINYPPADALVAFVREVAQLLTQRVYIR